jgi:hypothetical protein
VELEALMFEHRRRLAAAGLEVPDLPPRPPPEPMPKRFGR